MNYGYAFDETLPPPSEIDEESGSTVVSTATPGPLAGSAEISMATPRRPHHGRRFTTGGSESEAATIQDGHSLLPAPGRVRAPLSPEAEEDRTNLRRQRRELVDKKFAVGLSRREESQLKYLGWCLDRVRDAEIGPDLDRLEVLAMLSEDVARKIAAFRREVKNVGGRERP